MQSVLKKMAFSAGALALGVGLSACGKVKDMPRNDKQSQSEAPAGDVVPVSFQGIWSHAYHVYPPNEKDGTPQDGEDHFKLAADGTLYQLVSFRRPAEGVIGGRLELKYQVVGKVSMVTPHSAKLAAFNDFQEKLQYLAQLIGQGNPAFEILRITNEGPVQLCIAAWENDGGGILQGNAKDGSEVQCFERFTSLQMEKYLKETAKPNGAS
jgi:hypothetical protein